MDNNKSNDNEKNTLKHTRTYTILIIVIISIVLIIWWIVGNAGANLPTTGNSRPVPVEDLRNEIQSFPDALWFESPEVIDAALINANFHYIIVDRTGTIIYNQGHPNGTIRFTNNGNTRAEIIRAWSVGEGVIADEERRYLASIVRKGILSHVVRVDAPLNMSS